MSFGDLVHYPAKYNGTTVQTECLLTTDGFETHWLLRTLDVLRDTPIAYSLSEHAVGLADLEKALRPGKIAAVRIQGRFRVHENAMSPDRLSFVIERVLSASSVRRPNQSADRMPGSNAPEESNRH